MMKGDNKEGKTGRNNRKLITSAEVIKMDFPSKSRLDRTEIWVIFTFKETQETFFTLFQEASSLQFIRSYLELHQ